jgi:hypothetical protein
MLASGTGGGTFACCTAGVVAVGGGNGPWRALALRQRGVALSVVPCVSRRAYGKSGVSQPELFAVLMKPRLSSLTTSARAVGGGLSLAATLPALADSASKVTHSGRSIFIFDSLVHRAAGPKPACAWTDNAPVRGRITIFLMRSYYSTNRGNFATNICFKLRIFIILIARRRSLPHTWHEHAIAEKHCCFFVRIASRKTVY